jgi:hypothetical protein
MASGIVNGLLVVKHKASWNTKTVHLTRYLIVASVAFFARLIKEDACPKAANF